MKIASFLLTKFRIKTSVLPHHIMKNILFAHLILSFNMIYAQAHDNIHNDFTKTIASPETKIANWIKPTLADLSPQIIHARMQEKYKRFKIMNDNGEWTDPVFEAAQDKLLPPLNNSDLCKFVDDMASIASQNDYLHNILLKIEKEDLSLLDQNTQESKLKFLPDAIIYAKALDNLTYAARNIDEVLQTTYNTWEKRQEKIQIWSVASIPFCIKFFSVRYPLNKAIQCLRSKVISDNEFRTILPINILEATVYDVYKGNFGNAYAGWKLAINPPGGPFNSLSGSGPARISEDQKACQLNPPFTKSWNNLYCAWNLGFVAGFSQSISLNYISKLLIPSVNNHYKNPSEYMFNRTFALYATLNYELSEQYEEQFKKDNAETLQWYDPKIMNHFNWTNKTNADHYESLLEEI